MSNSVSAATGQSGAHGLSLAPFRGLRYASGPVPLGQRICPPYDVISEPERAGLIAGSDTNAVRLILPGPAEADLGGGDPYVGAAALLSSWVESGTLIPDPSPALYVYELQAPDGSLTRGLLGAVELRDPEDGVILPHENTMAGPVSDRLALMSATEANLEPIYLVYDGGGAASELVASMSDREPLSRAQTPDGVHHTLWSVPEADTLAAVQADLLARRALIADGHHRYATYRQLQADHHGRPGPWDRGLALLVDTLAYGPQVHPIHRVVSLGWNEIQRRSVRGARLSEPMSVQQALRRLADGPDFAVVLARDTDTAVLLSGVDSALLPEAIETAGATRTDAERALAHLDVNIVHRVLVERLWGLADTEETVGYAHDVGDALAAAEHADATAVLLRPTPVAAVAAVAAAGGRMPRKSTLFTPKPASGMVIRRFCDQ